MDEKNNVKDFFANPYAKIFLQNMNDSIRMAVSAITSNCVYADSLLENGGGTDGNLFEGVWEQCLNLMRTAEVTDAVLEGFNDRQLVNADDLLYGIATGSREILGEKFNITVAGEHDGFVMGNTKTLKYILLSVIRNIAIDSAGELTDTELVASRSDGRMHFIVKCDRSIELGATMLAGGDLSALNELLAANLGGKFVMKPDGCELILPLADPEDRVDLRSAVRYGEGGRYSPFNVMLGGLNDQLLMDDGFED